MGSRQRIVVITDDVLTRRMAGPAIRAWEIAGELSDAHEVVLATTSPVCDLHTDRFRAEVADPTRLAELEAWCDIMIVQGYVLERAQALRHTHKVMVVDLYDPIFLEHLELNRELSEPGRTLQIADAVRVFETQLTRGDYFICASEKQRDFWMGFLASAGRVNPANYEVDPSLRRLIDVIPFGLPDETPQHSGDRVLRGVEHGIGLDDDVILWGGGVYDWLDPVTAVRAIDRIRRVRPSVRLFFLGARHPSPFAEESRALTAARAAAEQLDLVDTHVYFNEGWVPYAARSDYLLEADIGISLHLDHVETTYSFRTRILDCFWAGLPVVATGGDALADLIDREGLGMVVPAENVEAVADALIALLEDKSAREEIRARAGAVAQRFVWPVVLEPLVRFCAEPVRAPDTRTDASELPTEQPDPTEQPLRPRTPARRLASLSRRTWSVYRAHGIRAVAAGSVRAVRRRL